MLRKPHGGLTASRNIGTRIPRLLPSSASSITQSDWIECLDQATTTQLASSRARPMWARHVLPAGMRQSQKTDQPRASSAPRQGGNSRQILPGVAEEDVRTAHALNHMNGSSLWLLPCYRLC